VVSSPKARLRGFLLVCASGAVAASETRELHRIVKHRALGEFALMLASIILARAFLSDDSAFQIPPPLLELSSR